MTTRRCAERMFFMRPDDEINNAFLYCALEAAQKFNIRPILPQMMSNHCLASNTFLRLTTTTSRHLAPIVVVERVAVAAARTTSLTDAMVG